MKKILSLVTLLCVALVLHGAVVNYTADNTTVFPNPERGYTVQADAVVTTESPRVLNVSSSWFSGGEKDNIRLCLYLSYLNNFKSQDLPDAILNAFDEDMALLRSNGWKCVLRFAYANTDNNDATLSWVQRHLQQLKPHLAANADVIYVMEAGFVGKYGEWYYSANYGDATQHMNDDRNAVVDALLANVPTDRFILLRTSMAKTEYLASKSISTAALNSSEAFTGTTKARLGHHNDALLADYGDAGTYASNEHSDDSSVRAYVAAETQYVPNGGETNVTDDDKAAARYANAPSEMSTYHWSFCGNSYATQMTSRWRTNGQYTTQNIYMGYRYNLVDGDFPTAATAGSTMAVTINIKNVGYAPMYNERPVYLVLKNGSKTRSILLTADPRRWAPSSETTYTINETVSLPNDLYAGTWHLYLHMPDKYASIAADPRYAVRFGNKLPGGADVWDSETGMNDLGADVEVDGPVEDGDNTLSAAISAASSSDVILLDGTYNESASFTIDKNITIKAAEGEEAIIKPSATISIPDNVTVTFEGVKFDLSEEASHLFTAAGTTGNNYLILKGCEVYGYDVASSIIYCGTDKKFDYCIVENCKIYNNKKSILFFHNTDTKYVRISNSSFYNITKDGSGDYIGIIDCRTSSGKIHVDHCTFYDCMAYNSDFGAIGYRTNAGYQTKVSNSIFQMKESNGDIRAIYLLETESRNVVENCLTYNYTKDSNTGVHSGPTLSGVNKFNTNPLFTDAEDADFTLQTSPTASPCLRAASDGSHMGDPRWWPTGTNINITIPTGGYKTYVTTHALNFSGISGLKAYVATSASASGVTMTQVAAVPAWTPLVLVGTANTYNVPVINEASASAPDVNLLRAGDGYTVFNGTTYDYILYSDGLFYRIGEGSVPYGKAYLHLDSAPSSSPGVRIIFEDNNATSLESVEAKEEAVKFIENGRFLIRKNGITYDALGRIIR